MFACWEKCFHEIFCIFLWGASYPDIRNKIIIGHAVYHPCEEYFRIYKDFTCYMQRIIVCMYVCFLVMVWLGKFLSFLVNKGLFYKCKRGWKGDEIKWCMVLTPLKINSLLKKKSFVFDNELVSRGKLHPWLSTVMTILLPL